MAESLYNLPPQVVSALQRGNLVEAIKLLREHRPQMGLAEAKALIDALQKQANAKVIVKPNVKAAVHQATAPHAPVTRPHVPQSARLIDPAMLNPHMSPGEVPRTSNMAAVMGILVGVVIVIAAIGYFVP